MTLETLFSLGILILSIIIHEIAHGYAANAYGDPTARLAGRLTLNPLSHLDPVGSLLIPGLLLSSGSPILFGWAKPVPYNPHNLRSPWGEAAVALAGSATNIGIAIIFGCLIRFAPTLPVATLSLAATITFTNLFLGLFNLIPFPPLDGFTGLRALLPWRYSRTLNRFEQSLRGAGVVTLLLFLFIFSSLLSGPFFSLMVRIYAALTGATL